MLLSVVSALVVAQSSLEVPEGLMNNPVLFLNLKYAYDAQTTFFFSISFKGIV